MVEIRGIIGAIVEEGSLQSYNEGVVEQIFMCARATTVPFRITDSTVPTGNVAIIAEFMKSRADFNSFLFSFFSFFFFFFFFINTKKKCALGNRVLYTGGWCFPCCCCFCMFSFGFHCFIRYYLLLLFCNCFLYVL